MATKLQRKILWEFIKEGGRGILVTGNKSTSWGDTLKAGGAIIYCSECVRGGLSANRWIKKLTDVYSGSIEENTARRSEVDRFSQYDQRTIGAGD